MIWYFTGGALALLACAWGIGLALLVLPRRWQRFWPAFCPACGLALQSGTVWVGANASLPGTQRWAVLVQLLPVAVFLLAVWRAGGWRRCGSLLRTGAARFWPQWLLMACCFVALTYPLTRPPEMLNAVSLGSCDAADYAGGGRVLLEFSRHDEVGFVAASEVTRVGTTAHFYEFWLRLNHFTPSALLALNGPVLSARPDQLVTVLGVVLHVLGLPLVFWLARAAFRVRTFSAGIITALYGFNPILLYAVYQTALGQLLAAPAVALLTWTGMQAFRAAGRGNLALWHWAPLFLVGHWIILGSYNFVLLFCYAPLLAWAGAQTIFRRRWRLLPRWLVFLALQVMLATALFPARVFTVIERLQLFQGTPFGWRIPPFGPAGWFGVFRDEKLAPAALPLAWAVGGLLLGALLLCGAFLLPRLRQRAFLLAGERWLLALAFIIPTFCGYVILLSGVGGSASYDGYKLFCVLYPGTLIGLCLWLDPWSRQFSRRFGVWVPGAALALLLGALQGLAWPRFNAAVRGSGLTLDPALRDVARIETLPEVHSLNLCLEFYWHRLWANALLLRRPQYFALPTYEGRRPTELRGDWDLRNRLLSLRTLNPEDTIELNSSFFLVRRAAPGWVDLGFGTGWFAAEQRRGEYWRWGGNGAEISLVNPHPYPVRAVLRFRGRTLTNDRPMDVDFVTPAPAGETTTRTPIWHGVFGDYYQSSENIPLELPPGTSTLVFRSPLPAREPTADDPRALMFALSQLEIDALEPKPAALSALP